MNDPRIVFTALMIILISFVPEHINGKETEPRPEEIRNVMKKVADWQIANPSGMDYRDWTRAACLVGMAAWAQMSGQSLYLDYLKNAGEEAGWTLYDRLYHADDHCIGWVYEELYGLYGDPVMIDSLKNQFDVILSDPPQTPLTHDHPDHKKRYNWCDALFMGPPVWIRLSQMTGNPAYADYAHQEFWATTGYLYDTDEHLFFRDDRYFEQREANGRKIFWSRGNGWVMAGMARILSVLPREDEHREKYEKLFREMAGKIAAIQPEDGLWRASLLDPESYPAPETSGTGFHCYAQAWGINNGILDRKSFLPVVQRAWAGMVNHVSPEGRLGYVQPVGADPREVTAAMSAPYGTGAFLLAGTEMYRLAVMGDTKKRTVQVQNPAALFCDHETVEIPLGRNGLSHKKEWVVFDTRFNRFLRTQKITIDGQPSLIFQASLAPGEYRRFWMAEKQSRREMPDGTAQAHAMFVPQRMDDFAWENDRIAFRMYGPALQARNEISSGVDVWVKSVRFPVLEKWYRLDNYHEDHGEGLDGYKVGSSRGCGGLGVWMDDSLCVSQNYTEWRILADGPIRTVFELTYAPWQAGPVEMTETKRITLDLGSNLSRFESRLTGTSGPEKLTVAAGIVRRGDGGDVAYNQERGWLTYWEPVQEPNGSTGCGAVVPGAVRVLDRCGHLLLTRAISLPDTFVYYAGACWSKGPDFGAPDAWTRYVKNRAARLMNPVRIWVE